MQKYSFMGVYFILIVNFTLKELFSYRTLRIFIEQLNDNEMAIGSLSFLDCQTYLILEFMVYMDKKK